jgi:tRNA pseudouridine38-40 synthase
LKLNYQIILEYDGTHFNGWQYQKNGLSVQNEVEKSLKKIFKKKIKVIGAGRTDAGVHATGQSANFEYDGKIIKDKFINSFNYFLRNQSISLITIKKKNYKFHSRRDAKKRIYKYFISNRIGSLVLDKNRSWHIKKKLNVKLMKKAAKVLEGTHDFSAFRASSCGAKSPIRTIEKSSVIKKGEKIIITFISRSFLQKQVRSMVGCIRLVGDGKWTSKNIKNLLKSKKRSLCAPPAPPYGLYLTKVIY